MEKGHIVATGSVLIEHKFFRNCGKVSLGSLTSPAS